MDERKTILENNRHMDVDAFRFWKKPEEMDLNNHFYKSSGDIECSEFENRLHAVLFKMHLIGYVRCKGVWNDNPYPVYWYYDETSAAEIKYNEFLGDEHLWQKEIVKISDSKAVSKEYHNLKKRY